MAISLISFGLLLGLLGLCLWQKGVVPESVSSLVYELEDKNRWVWSVWIAVVSVLLFPRMMDRLPEMWQFLGFLFVVCMLGVAVTPVFKKEKYTVHTWFGLGAGVLSQLIVLAVCPWWLLSWLGMAGICGYVLSKDEECWIDGRGLLLTEAISGLSLYGSLLFS